MMARALLVLLLLGFFLGGPVAAGVVEDAEEALQSVPSDNPAGHRGLDGSGGGVSAPSSSGSGNSSHTVTGPGSGGGSAVTAVGAGPSAGSPDSLSSGVTAAATPTAAEQEASSRQKARDRSDTAMSLVGVLVLLALVIFAGMYSKRAGRDD